MIKILKDFEKNQDNKKLFKKLVLYIRDKKPKQTKENLKQFYDFLKSIPVLEGFAILSSIIKDKDFIDKFLESNGEYCDLVLDILTNEPPVVKKYNHVGPSEMIEEPRPIYYKEYMFKYS